MEITEFKKITKKECIIVGYQCDICKKIHKGEDYPNDWYYFKGEHSEWGEDSYESTKWCLVCSFECYIKQLKQLYKNLCDYPSAIIADMPIKFVKKLLNSIDNYEKRNN